MRTILALAFIALLAGAMAHKSKAPVEESKLVSALKGLFQLANKDELEDVADVLAHVREEIEHVLAGVHSNYDDEEANAEDVISSYRSNLADLVSQIQGLEVEISSHEDSIAELQESIDAAVAAIEDATAQQANEEARRTDYHNAFRAKVDQLNAAVEAAEDALRLLQEIDTQDLSGSFLEINNKKIVAHFQAMHKSLHGMKLANSITPLTKMLVEVAAAGINHDLIAQLEDLLNQLIEIIEGEVNAAVRDDNNDDDYSRSTLANLQSTIDAQSDAAESNQEKVESLSAELEADQEWLSWLEDAASEAKRHAEEAESAWEEKSGNFRALIRRLERDIEALEAAENFVDRD